MVREIKSKLLEIVPVEDKEYEIAYIDIPNYAYVKRIDERITYPDVVGMGHKISNVLFLEENGDLYYCVTPHNEHNSSGLGTSKSFKDVDDEELKSCQKIINDFYPLVMNGMFTEEAKKIFEEFMTKVNEMVEKRKQNKNC